MASLVIVESPTKARTIRDFLPKGYVVAASMGHIRDLPRGAADVQIGHDDRLQRKIEFAGRHRQSAGRLASL